MLWAWMMSFGIPFPLLALRANKRFKALPVLPVPPGNTAALPSLSVIIPARNEEANLQMLLASLTGQQYSGDWEIIVVDDGSTDDTASVARQHNAKVIRIAALPAGWHGKPHACHTGALEARGDWLLFLDADICLLPGSISAAVHHADAQGLDGLSLFLKEITFGLVDRVSLMAAFAGLFAGIQGTRPFLNGQYILLRREPYFESGGFAEVRNEALEDLALAHLLRDRQFSVPMLSGETAGEVRMYNSARHLWQGMTRWGGGALHWAGPAGWLTALFITGALLPLVAVPLVLYAGMPFFWLILSWLLVTIGFLPWARRAGSVWVAPVAPLGALFIQLAAATGLLRSLTGLGIRWKDRIV